MWNCVILATRRYVGLLVGHSIVTRKEVSDGQRLVDGKHILSFEKKYYLQENCDEFVTVKASPSIRAT